MFDKRMNYLVVLDTETTALTSDNNEGLRRPLIYDIGWVIGDRNGREVFKREFLVKEIFTSDLMQNAFYGSKRPMYEARLEQSDILLKPFKEILELLQHDLQAFPKTTLCAYNLAFDLRALARTYNFCISKSLNKAEELFSETQQYQDLWGLSVEALVLPTQTSFSEFIIEYGLFTNKGNPKTSAEVVYRYATAQPDFIESHTALSDAEIEYELACLAYGTRRKHKKGILFNPWQKVLHLKKV